MLVLISVIVRCGDGARCRVFPAGVFSQSLYHSFSLSLPCLVGFVFTAARVFRFIKVLNLSGLPSPFFVLVLEGVGCC